MSRKQARRVRYLYQRLHQRPIGRNDDISLKFVTALLVERERHQINWDALAEQFCKRQGKCFESAREYRLRLEREGKEWPANKVGPKIGSETGGEDDWEVNVGGKNQGLGPPPEAHS
jgi:hypothetical protein